MNKVLFEVSYIGSTEMLLTVVFYILAIISIINDIKKKKNVIGGVILLIVFSGCLFLIGITYEPIVLEYKRGHYCEVEGIVEDYIKESKTEKFTINDVEFSYGVAFTWGYSLTLSKSVITGNGQHLRIRYIRGRNRNEIVYIEEIAED